MIRGSLPIPQSEIRIPQLERAPLRLAAKHSTDNLRPTTDKFLYSAFRIPHFLKPLNPQLLNSFFWTLDVSAFRRFILPAFGLRGAWVRLAHTLFAATPALRKRQFTTSSSCPLHSSLFTLPSSLIPLPSSRTFLRAHHIPAGRAHLYNLPGARCNCERTPISGSSRVAADAPAGRVSKSGAEKEKVSGRNGTAVCLPRTCADMPPSSGTLDFASSTICGQIAASIAGSPSVTVSPCHSGGSAIPS